MYLKHRFTPSRALANRPAVFLKKKQNNGVVWCKSDPQFKIKEKATFFWSIVHPYLHHFADQQFRLWVQTCKVGISTDVRQSSSDPLHKLTLR